MLVLLLQSLILFLGSLVAFVLLLGKRRLLSAAGIALSALIRMSTDGYFVLIEDQIADKIHIVQWLHMLHWIADVILITTVVWIVIQAVPKQTTGQ